MAGHASALPAISFIFTSSNPGSHSREIVSLDLSNDKKDISVLETNCDGSFPSVSPGGDKICFVSYDKDPSGNIVLFETKKRGDQTITEGPFIDFSPSWSSDGNADFFRE